MEIRQALLGDADGATDVVRRSIRELCVLDHQGDESTLSLWLANKTPANMRRWIETHTVFVAIVGDQTIGVAAVRADGEVLLNYVAPEARFQGVSKALMRSIEVWASEHDLEWLKLESSATALRFYLSEGWIGAEPSTPGFGVTMCHPMRKAVGGGRTI